MSKGHGESVCPLCKGEGEIEGCFPMDGGEGVVDRVVCPECHGRAVCPQHGDRFISVEEISPKVGSGTVPICLKCVEDRLTDIGKAKLAAMEREPVSDSPPTEQTPPEVERCPKCKKPWRDGDPLHEFEVRMPCPDPFHQPPSPDPHPGWTRSDAVSAIRHIAKQHGYAVAVHGSEVKDLDLILAPWTEEATADPAEVIESIVQAMPVVHAGPEQRPHGRVGWALRFTSEVQRGIDAWYIDASSFVTNCPKSPDSHPIAGDAEGAFWKLGEQYRDALSELTALKAEVERLQEVTEWLLSDDTGLSSEAIVGHMLGAEGRRGFRVGYAPSDNGDRRRCIRLLQRFPDWEPRLDELVAVNDEWAEQIPLIRSALSDQSTSEESNG